MRSERPAASIRSRASCGLGLRERDADAVHAVVLGGVDQQRAPAAADVEQALALGEPELAADQLELALLGGFERLVGSSKYAHE